MKKNTRWLLAAIAGLNLLWSGGCAVLLFTGGAAAGVGTVAFIKGELRSTQEIPYEQTFQGSVEALEELQFAITKQSKDALSATIVARGSNDKKITIQLNKTSETLTKIQIRVGMFGNQQTSQLILEKIKDRSSHATAGEEILK